MLDDLAPCLGVKGKNLLRRLNNEKDVAQALPAEMELALLWAVLQLGELEIEPDWWGDSKRPDAVTKNLVPGNQVALEIASVSNNSISGEEAMDAIALQISKEANSARKRTGNYLYFRFEQESGYLSSGRYFRRRLAPPDFKLPDYMANAVSEWIRSGAFQKDRLRLKGDGLDVEVEHTDHKQTRYHNIWSSMPPEAHSLEDNPLFELLVRKLRQLKAAQHGTLRMIFLADVGNTLVRRIGSAGEIDSTKRYVSAREIISHFVQKHSKHVDAVVTFSPFKEYSPFLGADPLGRKPRRWNVSYFGSGGLPYPPERLQAIAGALPEPHYEGYQARSLFRQGAYSPKGTGQYLGMTTKTNREDKNSIEFPARMLLDLLAGRLSPDRFNQVLTSNGRNTNLFKHWLDMGMTISGAEMAPRDVDEDDDHIILHFCDDPAARSFKFEQDRAKNGG